MERDCRKEVHTVVALSNSEGQTAGGTRERQQRRALATTWYTGRSWKGRRNEKGGKIVAYFFSFLSWGKKKKEVGQPCGREISSWVGYPGGSSSGCLTP